MPEKKVFWSKFDTFITKELIVYFKLWLIDLTNIIDWIWEVYGIMQVAKI